MAVDNTRRAEMKPRWVLTGELEPLLPIQLRLDCPAERFIERYTEDFWDMDEISCHVLGMQLLRSFSKWRS